MPVGDIAPEIVLILAAVASLLLATFVARSRQRLCAFLALAGLAVAAFLCATQLGQSRLTFSGVWAIDAAGRWGGLLILGATGFTVLLVPAWLETDRRHGEFYAVLLFSALGAVVMAGAADLLQLVMGVLLSSVTGYTLAAWHRDWPLSLEAGMKYFLVGAFANALLVIGVAVVFGMAGSSAYIDLAAAFAVGSYPPLLVLGVSLVVVGLAFKLGAVPAHAWVPDVAEGAPVPAAAFLTVVPKIGAAIALARLVDLFPPDALDIGLLVAVLAAATMTLGNLTALWQDDVRRLIGWSSVSQSGYALMAVCVIGPDGGAMRALLFFLLGYAVANLAAFAVVARLRGRTALEDYAGLAAARPWLAVVLIASFLSLVGIPPLVGFVGKLTLFVAVFEGGRAWLGVVAVANTVGSLFYYLRVVRPIWLGTPPGKVALLDGTGSIAVALGAAGLIGAGVLAEFGLAAFGEGRLMP